MLVFFFCVYHNSRLLVDLGLSWVYLSIKKSLFGKCCLIVFIFDFEE
jgi:hypothetical protein